MSIDIAARISEGKEILQNDLVKVEESARVFLGTLKGFRRDLLLVTQTCPKFIKADFPEPVHMIDVPPLTDGMSFFDLHEMLSLTEVAIDGKISIKNPPPSEQFKNDRVKIGEEIMLVHKNLLAVSEAAYAMYECIQNAGLEFDVFNSKNIEDECPQANIVFNRDEQGSAMMLGRALSERAIRIDIDLMESKRNLELGERQK